MNIKQQKSKQITYSRGQHDIELTRDRRLKQLGSHLGATSSTQPPEGICKLVVSESQFLENASVLEQQQPSDNNNKRSTQ